MTHLRHFRDAHAQLNATDSCKRVVRTDEHEGMSLNEPRSIGRAGSMTCLHYPGCDQNRHQHASALREACHPRIRPALPARPSLTGRRRVGCHAFRAAVAITSVLPCFAVIGWDRGTGVYCGQPVWEPRDAKVDGHFIDRLFGGAG